MISKTKLIRNVVSSTGLTKKDAIAAADAVFSAIQKALTKGGKIQLIGFSNFGVRKCATHKGRNPQTGQEVQIAISKAPTFRPGKTSEDAAK